jgi:hypothetical protein
MRSLLTLFVVISLGLPVSLSAQRVWFPENQEALFPTWPWKMGGYGGPQLTLTALDGEMHTLVGGTMALQTTSRLGITVGLHSSLNPTDATRLTYGVGGPEYTLMPHGPVQVSAALPLGLGRIRYTPVDAEGRSLSPSKGLMALATPEVSLGLRLGEYARLRIGGGYRVVARLSGPDTESLEPNGAFAFVRVSTGIYDPAYRRHHMAGRQRHSILSGTMGQHYTLLNSKFLTLNGGGVQWLINRQLGVGAAGFASQNTVQGDTNRLHLAMGGLWGTWTWWSQHRLNLSANLLAGVAQLSASRRQDGAEIASEILPMIQPSAQMGLNLTEWMRLGVGVGYRGVFGSYGRFGTAALSDWSGQVELRFGGF